MNIDFALQMESTILSNSAVSRCGIVSIQPECDGEMNWDRSPLLIGFAMCNFCTLLAASAKGEHLIGPISAARQRSNLKL